MKKKIDINTILLLFPIIDFFTSIASWNSWPSIGMGIKGIFLIYAIYDILKNSKERKIKFLLLGLGIYGIIFSLYWSAYGFNTLKKEMINLIKIFYLPLLILYFGTNKKIKPKTLLFLLLEFLLLYLIPYPFSLGHNLSEVYPNKELYLSYFYIGNELSNIFVLFLLPTFYYLIKEKKKEIFPTLILTICMLLLLGTKTMYLSVIIIILYLCVIFRHQLFSKIKKFCIPIGCISVILGTLLITWIPRSNLYQNIKTSLEFYDVKNIKELCTLENINHIIYSNRLEFLSNIHQNYKNSSFHQKIMGLGRTKIKELKDIEIDIFDIFYSIGILGIIVYVIFLVIILKYVKIKSVNRFTFILLGIISCFTGHVLLSPMTTTYLACLFGIERENQNERMDQKSTKKIKNRVNVK